MGLETRPLKRGLLTDRQMGHLTEPIGEDSEGDREGDPGMGSFRRPKAIIDLHDSIL